MTLKLCRGKLGTSSESKMSGLNRSSRTKSAGLLPASLPPTAPLRLHVAAAIAFPDGSMTVSGLRREVRRGNQTIEVIAGKQYVTLAAIEEMRARCRVPNNRPDSGFDRPAKGGTEQKLAQSGSFLMGEKARSAPAPVRTRCIFCGSRDVWVFMASAFQNAGSDSLTGVVFISLGPAEISLGPAELTK